MVLPAVGLGKMIQSVNQGWLAIWVNLLDPATTLVAWGWFAADVVGRQSVQDWLPIDKTTGS